MRRRRVEHGELGAFEQAEDDVHEEQDDRADVPDQAEQPELVARYGDERVVQEEDAPCWP